MKRIFIPLLAAAVVSCLFSCNNTENKTSAEQHKEQVAVPADTVINTIVLEEIAIGDANVKNALKMSRDGHFSILGKEVGVLSTNGQLKDNKGKVLAKMSGDQFVDANGKVLTIIKEDGTIVNGSGKNLSWDENGLLKNSEVEMYLTPANTKAKRAASILLFTYFSFNGGQAELTNKFK